MGREGKRFIRQYFPDWAKVQIRNALMIALNPGGTSFLQLALRTPVPRPQLPADEGILTTVRRMADQTPALFYTSLGLGISVAITYFLSTLGWAASVKHRPWEMVALLGIGGYLFAVSAGVVEARMRHPIMPMLCLLGGAGIVAVRRWTAPRPAQAATRFAALILHGRLSHLPCGADPASSQLFACLELDHNLESDLVGFDAPPGGPVPCQAAYAAGTAVWGPQVNRGTVAKST
jgi:hypothetical protein